MNSSNILTKKTYPITYSHLPSTSFDIAILQDTNWFQVVNASKYDIIVWGRNRGCDFFNFACEASTAFPEFDVSEGSVACGFHQSGMSLPVTDAFMDNCPTYEMYSNANCKDVT